MPLSLPQCRVLTSYSELDGIEGQLRSLYGRSQRRADTVEGDGNTLRLLEDLQEAIFRYQVCSRPGPLLGVNLKENRWEDEPQLTTKYSSG